MTTNIECLPWASIVTRLNNLNTDSLLIIIDKKVSKQFKMSELFSSAVIYECVAGEELKTIEMYEKCMNFFLEKGVHRKSHLIAIGGGTVSDFAGFVASTLLRGISWSIVPTTLLGMVDAAIGGKTGLNTDQGKNLIGTFHLPESVLIDISFLNTLDKKHVDSGYGEVLKYSFLSPLIKKELLRGSEKLVYKCALYKNKIVEDDFRENGDRKKLNLGHTFGHCIEKITGIEHGEAVIVGLKMIIDIYGDNVLKEEFIQSMNKLGLNCDEKYLDAINTKSIMSFLIKDKKVIGNNKIEVIIPVADGPAEIRVLTLDSIHDDLEKYFIRE